MSRRFAGTSVTSRPPIRTGPVSTSSRPASIRSAVVLPEPDGPTSTMNSPSPICRSKRSTAGTSVPGYVREVSTNVTSANTHLLHLLAEPCLSLRARAQPVEAEQGGAGDRRDRRRADDPAVAEGFGDRVDESAVPGAQQAAAEQHLDGLAAEVETVDGG